MNPINNYFLESNPSLVEENVEENFKDTSIICLRLKLVEFYKGKTPHKFNYTVILKFDMALSRESFSFIKQKSFSFILHKGYSP